METITDCDWSAPGMPVTLSLGTVRNFAGVQTRTGALLPVDSVRRVSINLHKCSKHAAVNEKKQPKLRPYTEADVGRVRGESVATP